MTNKQITAGDVLLSQPFMLDPNFRRTAVLVCEHNDDEGSIGFILNKKLDVFVDELISDLYGFQVPVFFGGPVATDTIHYVHNVGELLENSHFVSEGVWWGGDFDKLKFLISSGLVKPGNIRFFVGYSGWSDGQLKEEMASGSWLIADMDANYIFNSRSGQLWEKIMANKGNPFTVISTMPDEIALN